MECYPGDRFYNLEYRNNCAKPERECDPLWDIIQFPIRCRSTPSSRECDDRLLQDGITHHGCNPSPGGRHAYSDSYTYAHSYAYFNTNSYPDPNTDANTKAYSYTETSSSDSGASPVGPSGERALGWP